MPMTLSMLRISFHDLSLFVCQDLRHFLNVCYLAPTNTQDTVCSGHPNDEHMTPLCRQVTFFCRRQGANASDTRKNVSGSPREIQRLRGDQKEKTR